MAETMYQSGQAGQADAAGAGGGPSAEASGSAPGDDEEVIDAEYVDVDK